jgi:hypothetical protein
MQHVIERWNAAIANVLARVDATLADASAGSQAVIAHIGSDLTPLVQPWAAVEHQMHQYREQVADTWLRISDELSRVSDLPDGVMWLEGGKRERKDVPLDLLREYERASRGYWTTRLTIEADFAPEQRPFVERRIESSMKGVNKTLRQHWQWRQSASG